jgi:hypothetical protein
LLRAADREVPHALDDPDALRHRYRTARVEGVEDVRALQRPVVARQHQLRVEAAARLAFIGVEELPVQVDVGRLEVILRELVLVLLPHRAVADPVRPVDVEHRALARQEHRQPLQPVGDLRGDRRQVDPTGLLEVGELGDLHPVEEDLPADPPRTERRRLPVVFLEADVVLGEVEPERAERVEIKLLHFERRRFEDHLKLIVLAEPERIVAIAPVRRPPRRLHVADAPGLRPEHAQKGRRMHRPGTDLQIERSLDDAPPLGPEVLQLQNQ